MVVFAVMMMVISTPEQDADNAAADTCGFLIHHGRCDGGEEMRR